MARNSCSTLFMALTAVLVTLLVVGTGGAEAYAQPQLQLQGQGRPSGEQAVQAAQVPPTTSSRTIVVGTLSVAEARWAGSDLRINMGGVVSFMVPGNAGYMVYERADTRGTKHLCIARYGASGMEFEIMIDAFALDTDTYTPLDSLGLSILSAGKRVEVLDSRDIAVGNAVGLDLTFRGAYVDRQLPKNDARMVMLTDMTNALMFTLVERQPKPEEHREALDQVVRTVVFSSSAARA